jgi:prepilin-type processing-associated H-X9-DG protein
VHKLKAEGMSNRAIAARIGVTENAVRKLVLRLGFKEPRAQQQLLPLGGAHPNLSGPSTPSAPEVTTTAPAEPAAQPNSAALAPAAPGVGADPNLSAFQDEDEPLPITFDTDPADRKLDRLFACLGLLDDAAPLFRPGAAVPHAGVLLAVPALLSTGVLTCARKVYGSLGPAFYGLRTSILALLLMALLRIKRPEALKEHSPPDLGRLLGLDRAPEVKTLRRKLARLAKAGRAAEFGRTLAMRRVATHGQALGFLYLDGHVRVYHGRHKIPKTHVARMRIALPATTDYWVNDQKGEPLFVVTALANAGLTAMLLPLLGEIRTLVGERRVTVVFDRGGWSPKLFAQLLAQGFELLTYRKGPLRPVPKRHFHEQRQEIDGQVRTYTLADQRIRLLGGRLRLRQVTRLRGDHQTPIVTSRRELSAVEVAFRMFERWRQENFFKYLREEYALDALVEHAVEADDAKREVPNPHWAALATQIRAVRAEISRLSVHYGIKALANPEAARRTMRGFKIAHAKEGGAILSALKRHAQLEARRAKVPRRVPVAEVVEGPVIKLAAERKHLTNLLKMVAYQAETELVRALASHYRRAEQEGRTLIQAALASAADIEPGDSELRVTLARQSSPHRTRAVAALCAELNRSSVRFPGTMLHLRFLVASEPADRTNR